MNPPDVSDGRSTKRQLSRSRANNPLAALKLLLSLTSLVLLPITAHSGPPWFSGYLNPTNSYRIYAFTDWDSPLFGAGIDPDSDCLGVAAPSRRVDGHVVLEADGTGNCVVIEATGSYSGWLGQIHPVSFQFSGWWCNPSSAPTSDTRHDYSSEFLNVVSDPLGRPDDTNAIPVFATISAASSNVAIAWQSQTNRNYRVMWAPSLGGTNTWYFLGTTVAGTGLTNTVYDTATNNTRFYRVVSQE